MVFSSLAYFKIKGTETEPWTDTGHLKGRHLWGQSWSSPTQAGLGEPCVPWEAGTYKHRGIRDGRTLRSRSSGCRLGRTSHHGGQGGDGVHLELEGLQQVLLPGRFLQFKTKGTESHASSLS